MKEESQKDNGRLPYDFFVFKTQRNIEHIPNYFQLSNQRDNDKRNVSLGENDIF